MRLHRRLALLTAALLLMVLSSAAASAASAASADQSAPAPLVIAPAGGSSLADGGWFLLDAQPGDTAHQTITIRNDRTTPTVVRVAAVDAGTGNLGGVSYAAAEEQPAATATWITLDADHLELAAGGSASVEFAVAIPPDAEGGTHLAGIAVWQPTDASETTVAATEQTSASIVMQTRHVIAVQVDLPGGVGPQLVIEDVEVLVLSDGLHLGLHLANTGSQLTAATGSVTMPDGTTRRLSVATMVPRTTTVYPIRWTDTITDGTYPIAAELSYAGEATTFDGQVVVGDAIQAQLVDRRIQTSTPMAVPMWLLGAVLTVALIGAVVLIRHRRAPRPRGPHIRTSLSSTPALPPPHVSGTPPGLQGWSTPAPR